MTRGALLAVVLSLAACGGDRAGDGGATTVGGWTSYPTTSETMTTTATEAVVLRLYFVRGEHVGVATREVPPTQAVAAAALRELLRGPDDAERGGGLTTAIPDATRLNGVAIAGGVATVDLAEAFASGGGSASMQLRVAQVVHTLTQFPTVERVAFRLDGEPVDAIGGEGVVVSPPVDRADFEAQAPAILVESLAPGDEIRSPLRVTGTANTFEATFILRVDQGGRAAVERFVTATSGSGTRGTFDVTIEFDAHADGSRVGTVAAFERSAVDGSRTHAVAIPVRFRP